MGYVKKAYRKIFNELDYNYCLPDGWDDFVDKQTISHNLIIKSSKNKCHCTNCNYTFTSTKKVNEETKCPYCHNKYLIKRSNLRYYDFKDYLSILNIVNDTFVIRYFELKTIIDSTHEPHSTVVEFAREIPTNNYYRDVYVNDRVSKCQCHIYIHHSNSWYFDETKWREYTRNYSLIDYSIVFPNNLKRLLKNTEYKYSCIWELAKHSTYIDLLKLLKNTTSLAKVESLTKMKLYNLALRTGELCGEGSFQKIFGVSKDYYPFMKRNNITYKQLKLLRLLQEKNIDKIKYLEKFVGYGENTDNLEEIAKYIPLNRFIQYAKLHRGKVDIYMYKDYLRLASILGYDLKDKKTIFPIDLKQKHDEYAKQYKIQSEKIINKAIVKRGEVLSINAYKTKKYIITPAPTLKSLINESKQQKNCVRTYAERYAQGKCDIYFMRDIKNPKKSLVTVEVKNNKVVQSRIKNNRSTTEEQDKVLDKWEQEVLKGAA